ncbi:type 2 lanthipeptide synthetase LanM family protein [Chamaesiphon polymorphus]|uniref:type 2 lanthipeptide synthetase LanM family protein n=1 Tax=Chamaesiphon polymorphus TaxID=2107691 RepID=UPI001C6298CC|nr:type 2 lanthipeptide synthetase LanM family protein [Chamaesiphon polymorphus]
MELNQSTIATIFSHSTFISEWLSAAELQLDPAQIDESKAKIRLDRWCQVVAQGNWDKFQLWLDGNGWELERVRLLLGSNLHKTDRPLPDWATTLSEILQSTRSVKNNDRIATEFANSALNGQLTKDCTQPEHPLPFEDLLLPIVRMARQKLGNRLDSMSLFAEDSLLSLLSETAYLSLERDLLQRLLNLLSKTLILEFSRFRPLGYSLLNQVIKQQPGAAKQDYYHDFVNQIAADGWSEFFSKYPVLARFVAITVDFWVVAVAEFIQYLQADLSEIDRVFNYPQQSEQFGAERQLGKVVEIQPSLSDPHNQNRSVIIFTFESGLKLVYKPKNLGLDIAYYQFVEWCNQRNVLLDLKVLKVLDRDTYGWVEYVEHLPCTDLAAAQRFYRRAGMLLCLVRLLAGTDCHYENLIASNEHLVLVDLETLLHHDAKPMTAVTEATAAQTLVERQFEDSVLYTGLLPFWAFSEENGSPYDFSGLGSVDPQQSPKRLPVWKSINTDDMRLEYEIETMPIQANVPVLNGVALSPHDYIEELVTGFKQMYRFLLSRQEELLAQGSPLEPFQAQLVRFIFRVTSVYGAILQRNLSPDSLRSGIDWSIELDIMSRAFLTTDETSPVLSICQGEIAAMQQLDIPYFGAITDSDALTIGVKQSVLEYFKESSYRKVVTQIHNLNEDDLALQVEIIQLAFYAKVAQNPVNELDLRQVGSIGNGDESGTQLATSAQLIDCAQAIAAEIEARAIRGNDGSVTWIGFGFLPQAERFQLQPLSYDLYDGKCGVSLFLAALDFVSGSYQFRDLVLGSLQPLVQILHAADAELAPRFAKEIGIGGATGLGSLIYSLVKTSQFLRLPALIEEAIVAADLMTAEIIAADRQFDVMGGAAGAILGLLALYRETAQQEILDKAIACGEHLLAHSASVDSMRTWHNFGSKPLTGFSHGAAGITYALLRLYAATQNRTYLAAARESIAYERSVFCTAAANWPDFRAAAGASVFLSSWCHGASGIGLGRLGGLSIDPTAEILAEIEIALETTQKYSLQDVDQLCCGNLGRCEVLLVASQLLDRPQLYTTALQEGSQVIDRAKQTGSYQLFGNLPNSVFSPSFFQGTAGIGYQLLRLADTASLPSVLLWD